MAAFWHRLLTTWDSRKDAEEFAAAYAEHRAKALAPAADKSKPEAKPKDASAKSDAESAALRPVEQGGRTYLVERRGKDVAVIEGFSPEVSEKVLAEVFAAKKSTKRFQRAEKASKEAAKPRP